MKKGTKFGSLFVGLATFVLGLMLVALFTGVFESRFVPLAVLLGAIGLIVFKFKCGGCCSR